MKMIMEKLMRQDNQEALKNNKKYKNKDSIYTLLYMFSTIQDFSDF